MSSSAYRDIGALLPLLGSDDDVAVGRALDQLDALLARHNLSWVTLGQAVARLADPAKPTLPQSRPNGPMGVRPPSQWKIDRDLVMRAHPRRHELDGWGAEFVESIHEWCVLNQRGLSEAQRLKLYEQLDKLGLE